MEVERSDSSSWFSTSLMSFCDGVPGLCCYLHGYKLVSAVQRGGG